MKDGEILLQTRLFQVICKLQRTPDGKEHPRQVIRHPGAAVILPLLKDDRLVLVRNYRISVEEALLELPAGTLDPGEDPIQAAGRELAEETGYRAGSLELLAAFYSSPGILDERMHLFLATGLEPGPVALQAGEEVQPLVVSWEEGLRMIRTGGIRDAKTLVGLLYYEVFCRGAGRREGPC